MQKLKIIYCWAVLVALGRATAGAQNPDILIEDFEGTNYGAWTVTGTAFGNGPAQALCPIK